MWGSVESTEWLERNSGRAEALAFDRPRNHDVVFCLWGAVRDRDGPLVGVGEFNDVWRGSPNFPSLILAGQTDPRGCWIALSCLFSLAWSEGSSPEDSIQGVRRGLIASTRTRLVYSDPAARIHQPTYHLGLSPSLRATTAWDSDPSTALFAGSPGRQGGEEQRLKARAPRPRGRR